MKNTAQRVHPFLHLLGFQFRQSMSLVLVALVFLVVTDQVLAHHPRFASFTVEERGAALGVLLVATILGLGLIASQRTPRQLSLVLPVAARLLFLAEVGAATLAAFVLMVALIAFTNFRVFLGALDPSLVVFEHSSVQVLSPTVWVVLVMSLIPMTVLLIFCAALVSGRALLALVTLTAWIAIALSAVSYVAFPWDVPILILFAGSLILLVVCVLSALERIAMRRHPAWQLHLSIGILLLVAPSLYLANLYGPRLGAARVLGHDFTLDVFAPHIRIHYLVDSVRAEPTAFGLLDRRSNLEVELLQDWLVLEEDQYVRWARSLRTGKIVSAPHRSKAMKVDRDVYLWHAEPGAAPRLVLTSLESSNSHALRLPEPRIDWEQAEIVASHAPGARLILDVDLGSSEGFISFLASPADGSVTYLGRRTSRSRCRRFIALERPGQERARLYDIQQEALIDLEISSWADPICDHNRLAIKDGKHINLYSLARQGVPELVTSFSVQDDLLPGWSNDHPYYFNDGALLSVLYPERPLVRFKSEPAAIGWQHRGLVLFEFQKNSSAVFDPSTGRVWFLKVEGFSWFGDYAVSLRESRFAMCDWRGCVRCSLTSGLCRELPLDEIPVQWIN